MPHDISANAASLANFAPFAERMHREELPDIVIDNFHHYYDVLSSGSVGLIAESEIEPVASVPDITDLAGYRAAGEAAMKQTAVLKLNGGLGTSMGLEKAKSLLVVRDGLTFLAIIARQNISLDMRYGTDVPLILMNSFNTDADSLAALERYPELQGPVPFSVMQHKIPKVLQDTLAPAEWLEDPELEWCPPGHGEVYVVLATSGLLDTLLARGYEYLFLSNVDNLGATVDPGILGYIASRDVPFLMEVTDRTEADKKGGHIARLHDGQLILREVAQCPREDLAAFQDIARHRYFNTNNIWVRLSALKRILDENDNVIKLPMIRNAKTLDPKDKDSPAVFQLETAMGAAIAVFPGSQVLRVGRDRFLPVKTCSDLLRLRSDIYELDEHYEIHAIPDRASDVTLIDLDARYYQLIDDFETRFSEGVPSLRQCASLTVEGDVVFGAGVVCKGAARIVNRVEQQVRLPAATVVEDAEYALDQHDVVPALAH